MTIQLTKATYVSGVLAAAGSQHTLDAETEAYLVHIGAATWVDAAYTQGRFEDAKIEYDSDGVAVGIVGRANEVVGPVWATDASGNVTGLVGPDGETYTGLLDPRAYGAKCDGQYVLDASVSTGTTTVTITSATAAFTAADVGKLCAVMTSSTTGPWSARSGTITAYTSATTITVSLSGSSAALTNAQFVWGTEDTAAWTSTFTDASSKKKSVLVPLGISVVQNISVPDRVGMYGVGADRTITWPYGFIPFGSAIVCLKWPGVDATPVVNCLGRNVLTGFTIDAFKTAGHAAKCDSGGADVAGHSKWHDMTFARGYSGVIFVGPAHSVTNSTIWGQEGLGPNVKLTGDGRLIDCDVYGAGNNYAAVLVSGHDVVVANNHFWKNASSSTDSLGPSVLINPSATTGHTGNCVITGNMFDTSHGPHVHIKIDGTVTAHIIKVTNNDGFQNDYVNAATYPYIDIDVAVGAVIKGLVIEGNTGMASWSGGNYGTYTVLVDGAGVAGNIYGSRTGGNVVDGAAALYTFSPTWTAWDHNGGDLVIPYGGTSVTASTTT